MSHETIYLTPDYAKPIRPSHALLPLFRVWVHVGNDNLRAKDQSMKLITPLLLVALLCAVLLWPPARNAVFHRGISWCERCQRTWDVVDGHGTPYADAVWEVRSSASEDSPIQMQGVPNDGQKHLVFVVNGRSCFPLCEQCWADLKTPEARLPYYRALMDRWVKFDKDAETNWAGMKAAVMAGK